MKVFIVGDFSPSCRENIGFLKREKEEEVKEKIRELAKSNYGIDGSELDEFMKRYIIITQTRLIDEKKIEDEFADGMNWGGDLDKIDPKDLEEGAKQRLELARKFGYKGDEE
jgi:hypothetical protein